MSVFQGDTEEISTLLVIIIVIQWLIYAAAIPIFIQDIFYYPGWLFGILAFLYYSYLVIEVGFLKIFFRFRNARIVQNRLDF